MASEIINSTLEPTLLDRTPPFIRILIFSWTTAGFIRFMGYSEKSELVYFVGTVSIVILGMNVISFIVFCRSLYNLTKINMELHQWYKEKAKDNKEKDAAIVTEIN
jgi:hypothetical protein